MSIKEQLEMEMARAQVAANRSMREATTQLDDEGAWHHWQQAEQRAAEARKRWQEASEEELQHAA